MIRTAQIFKQNPNLTKVSNYYKISNSMNVEVFQNVEDAIYYEKLSKPEMLKATKLG